MATTTNYGWTTPDDTALVKDGAAAIRTLGSSVDTTTKNLNPETTLGDIAYRSSTANVNTRLPLGTAGQVLKVNSGATAPEWSSDNAGMTNPMTTTGDTIYSSSGSTPARLGIGSTGNVLTVAGGVPTWAAPAGGGMTVISSGSLTGSSISVTSISGYNDLVVVLRDAYNQSGGGSIQINVNGDTGAYYNKNMLRSGSGHTYTTGANGWGMDDAAFAPAAASNANSYVLTLYDVANTTSQKMVLGSFVFTRSDSARSLVLFNGIFTNGTAAITSIGIKPESGNFGGGTYIVYGVK
jgi:hypothetical protein